MGGDDAHSPGNTHRGRAAPAPTPRAFLASGVNRRHGSPRSGQRRTRAKGAGAWEQGSLPAPEVPGIHTLRSLWDPRASGPGPSPNVCRGQRAFRLLPPDRQGAVSVRTDKAPSANSDDQSSLRTKQPRVPRPPGMDREASLKEQVGKRGVKSDSSGRQNVSSLRLSSVGEQSPVEKELVAPGRGRDVYVLQPSHSSAGTIPAGQTLRSRHRRLARGGALARGRRLRLSTERARQQTPRKSGYEPSAASNQPGLRGCTWAPLSVFGAKQKKREVKKNGTDTTMPLRQRMKIRNTTIHTIYPQTRLMTAF